VAVALHAGAAALWLPLAAVALLSLGAVGLLARRMTTLTLHVAVASPAVTRVPRPARLPRSDAS